MTNYQTHITSSTLIHTGAGILAGLVCSVSISSSAVLTLYDNTAASGTVIFRATIAPPTAEQPFVIFFPDRFAPRFNTGLYASLSIASSFDVVIWATGF